MALSDCMDHEPQHGLRRLPQTIHLSMTPEAAKPEDINEAGFIMAWDNSMDYQHLHDLRWCCGLRWSFEKVQSLFLDSIIAQSQGSPEARPQVWGLSLCLLKLQAVVHHLANPVGQ